jgi:hypothetical protein
MQMEWRRAGLTVVTTSTLHSRRIRNICALCCLFLIADLSPAVQAQCSVQRSGPGRSTLSGAFFHKGQFRMDDRMGGRCAIRF